MVYWPMLKKKNVIYFWLCWVVAGQALSSLVVASREYSLLVGRKLLTAVVFLVTDHML